VIFRDGRPFSAGLSASSLPFPYPSTIAGMMRTMLGAPSNYEDLDVLNCVSQVGPFLVTSGDDGESWQYAFPAPSDAVAYEPAEPQTSGRFNLKALTPGMLNTDEGVFEAPGHQFPFGATEDKPSRRLPRFWTWEFYQKWLVASGSCISPLPREVGPPAMPRQRRIHVAISPVTQTAAEAMLFATESLEFLASEPVQDALRQQKKLTRYALVSRFQVPDSLSSVSLAQLGVMGGEGRIITLNEQAAPPLPSCPDAIKNGKRIRIILATPGLFPNGWRPDWLTEQWEHPSGFPQVRLKLVSASVPRAIPISGWDYAKRKPKPSRLLAPAGSVYFCEAEGDASGLWFKSICNGQAALDGFGIVTLGVW
jgi:CRISPR-associated protein Cmr3